MPTLRKHTMGAARLPQLLRRALREAGIHPAHSKVAVALSGGPDSVALAGLIAQWTGELRGAVSHNRSVRSVCKLVSGTTMPHHAPHLRSNGQQR